MNELLSIKQAAAFLGIHPDTLRIWDNNGKIKSIRTNGGHRRYEKSDLIRFRTKNKAEEKLTIAYARVSSSSQKEDLNRQIDMLSMYCTYKGYSFKVISDIGSGLNYNKKGLKELIELIESEQCQRIVINYKDRLLRFGFELIEQICKIHNVRIEIINQTKEENENMELVDDVLSIITVYSAKLYGARSHKNKEIVEKNKQLFNQ